MKKKHTQSLKETQVDMIVPEEKPVDALPQVTQPDPEVQNRYGYQDINSAPRNGTLIVVSETGHDEGTIAFWKKTRAFANATHKWEATGFFAGNISNARISFTPKFWRVRGINEI